jgi:hypothetical protein
MNISEFKYKTLADFYHFFEYNILKLAVLIIFQVVKGVLNKVGSGLNHPHFHCIKYISIGK